MGLEQRTRGGSYYYWTIRRGGQVVSIYGGGGDLARLAAQFTQMQRQKRECERQALLTQGMLAIDQDLAELGRVRMLCRAELCRKVSIYSRQHQSEILLQRHHDEQRKCRQYSGMADIIRRTLEVLFLPGQVVELRVPNVDRKQRTDSGYFTDLDRLAQKAAQYDGSAAGVYVTLNPVNPALLARAENRVQAYTNLATQDRDIEYRLATLCLV